jgi:hypothetical protein
VDRTVKPGFTVQMTKPSPQPSPQGRGSRRLAGIAFDYGSTIALAGALEDGPASVTLALGGRKAAELAFLWSASLATAKEAEVATLRVAYSDGKSADMPILYGRQISAGTDQRASAETVTVNRKNLKGVTTSQRVWRWTNPRPAVGIKTVTIESRLTECAPSLLGLTGIQ